MRRRWLSLFTVWPSHSQWPIEKTRQCAYPFYSTRAGFYCKELHHPGLSAPIQPTFGSLRLLVLPKAKIAVEREEMRECDGHTVHKLSQRRLIVDWLNRLESDCSRMNNKVSSDWLPCYIKSTRMVLEIFKMAGYFADTPSKMFILSSFVEIVVEKQKFEINIYKKSSVTDNKVSYFSQSMWKSKILVEMFGVDIEVTYRNRWRVSCNKRCLVARTLHKV